jgi:hypothetical protein
MSDFDIDRIRSRGDEAGKQEARGHTHLRCFYGPPNLKDPEDEIECSRAQEATQK